jgi:hypothetical protein
MITKWVKLNFLIIIIKYYYYYFLKGVPKTKDIRTSNPKKKKRGKERVKATSDLGGISWLFLIHGFLLTNGVGLIRL